MLPFRVFKLNRHSLLLCFLALVLLYCSTYEAARDNVLVNELEEGGDLSIIGIERYENDFNFGSIKYYLLTELNGKLRNIKLTRSASYTSTIDSSLVKHSLIVEMQYRDNDVRRYTKAKIGNYSTNQLKLSQPKISDCSYFSNTCKYVTQLKIDMPSFVLHKQNVNGLYVNVTNDSLTKNISNINLFIDKELINKQIEFYRLYEYTMIWSDI